MGSNTCFPFGLHPKKEEGVWDTGHAASGTSWVHKSSYVMHPSMHALGCRLDTFRLLAMENWPNGSGIGNQR